MRLSAREGRPWLPGKAVLIAAYHPQYLGYNEGDEQLRSDYYRLFREVKEIVDGKRKVDYTR